MSNEFLNFDYIGAPWPNDKKWKNRFKKIQQRNI